MRVWMIASLMAMVALSGCFGDDDSGTNDCPEQGHMDSMDHGDSMDHSMDETADGNDTDGNETEPERNQSGSMRTSLLQPGNETEPDGNETDGNGTDEPEALPTNEAGPEAQSGAADCPEEVHGDDGEVGIGAGAFLVADNETGTVPFDVLFEFGVTSIPEDEFLTWTLDVNGDGTPEAEGNGNNLQGGANFTFTYTEAGTYNATFEADDGFESWNATLVITATEPEGDGDEGDEGSEDDAPEIVPGGPYPQVLTFETSQANAAFFITGPVGCVSWLTGQGGIDCAWQELDPAWIGRSYTSDGPGDVDLAFAPECSVTTTLDASNNGATGHDSGSIPEGMGCIIVTDFSSSGTLTVTIA